MSNFFGETFTELKKVIWPSWENVKRSAKVVIVSTVILSAFFGGLDYLLTQALINLL